MCSFLACYLVSSASKSRFSWIQTVWLQLIFCSNPGALHHQCFIPYSSSSAYFHIMFHLFYYTEFSNPSAISVCQNSIVAYLFLVLSASNAVLDAILSVIFMMPGKTRGARQNFYCLDVWNEPHFPVCRKRLPVEPKLQHGCPCAAAASISGFVCDVVRVLETLILSPESCCSGLCHAWPHCLHRLKLNV